MDFILGIILGIFLLTVFRIAYQAYQLHITLIKPLDKFIDSDISLFEFIERKNTLVKLQYDKDCYLVIMTDSKNVNIFIKDKLMVYSVDENKKKIDHLFNKLADGFYHEIYTNITKLNGNIFSNNLLVSDQNDIENEFDESVKFKINNSFTPSIDDILDKISKTGMGSLTKTELTILKKNS
tara:strand:+ start:5083 stop:5625 length:543 start_codon:yes stop_codon:yes gene_type:complete